MAGANKNKWMVAGSVAAAGMAAVYFLDQKHGQARRKTFATEVKRLGKEVGGEALKSARDSWHHVAGPVRQAWSGLGREWPNDRVLVERIRSRMGRLVSHPHKIHVVSDDGVVTLWGAASEEETRKFAHAVQTIPGVRQVINHLEIRGDHEPAHPESSVFQRARRETLLNWSPAERMAVGIAGTAAAIYGWKRRDLLGVSISLLGAGLAAASTLKKNVHSLLAFSEDSPGFELEQTIRIHAPVSDIYDFWANPENYPKVFSHISAIEKLGENRFRWTVTGPGGIPVHWDGAIIRAVPNTLVEWKSLPGSTVGNLGFVRVDPNYDASTRVLVRMFYRPPAGILGRVIAEMLGVDPKKVLAQDLARLKTLFENDEAYMKDLKTGDDHELLKIATT